MDNDGDGLIDCDDPQCGCLNFHIFCHHPCPSQITLRPGRENDILTIRTGLYPSQSFDPTTVPVSVMISNANGIIFAAVLPAGIAQEVERPLAVQQAPCGGPAAP